MESKKISKKESESMSGNINEVVEFIHEMSLEAVDEEIKNLVKVRYRLLTDDMNEVIKALYERRGYLSFKKEAV